MNESPFIPFVIDDKPFCLWDAEIRKINIKTINRIDSKYFSVMAQYLLPLLETENKQYGAISLRTQYSHALETLFALLCATVQAPDCIVGWLLKYQNKDLFSLVKKIQGYEMILTKYDIDKPHRWENIANFIFTPLKNDDENEKQKIIESFGKLWGMFANDFLKQDFTSEYNSIKHGLRLHMGGFSLAMGVQNKAGEIVPPERMRMYAKSDFGSTFFETEKIQNSSNFVVHEKSINWNPENFVIALNLISTSIQNITSFLKIVNGENSPPQQFLVPNDEEFYKRPWEKQNGGFTSFGMNSLIDTEKVEPIPNREILKYYGV